MKSSRNKILIILAVFIIVVIGATVVSVKISLNQSSPAEEEGTEVETGGEETVVEEPVGYPDNLLEGTIVDIALQNPSSFLMEADVSKLDDLAEQGKMEKTIKITEGTKIVVYNMLTEKEQTISIGDLELGDNVLVVTQESTYQNVLTKEEFTATKVSKMVNFVQPE